MTDNVECRIYKSVAYLECAKGGGPGGVGTDVPQWGLRAKPPVGSRGKAPVWGLEADAFLLLNA